MANLYNKVLAEVQRFIEKCGGVDHVNGKLTASRPTLYRAMLGDKSRGGAKLPGTEIAMAWLEEMGAKIIFPDVDEQPDSARNVCFVNPRVVSALEGAPPPEADDYLAVPLADEAVAAGPGRIPADKIRSWVIVWRHHESVRLKTDLVAVEIGKNERSMLPLFSPGDILLVDRADKNPDPPGKIMLVCEPGQEGGCAVKRVSMVKDDGDYALTFYSENAREYPPVMYKLGRDYDNNIGHALAGAVVWAWSDVRKK